MSGFFYALFLSGNEKHKKKMTDLTILINNPELARNIKLEVSGADLVAFGEWLRNTLNTENQKNTPKKQEEYLTPKQLSEALHISLVTLWNWDKKKITRPLHIGTQKRYRRSDLELILNQK